MTNNEPVDANYTVYLTTSEREIALIVLEEKLSLVRGHEKDDEDRYMTEILECALCRIQEAEGEPVDE